MLKIHGRREEREGEREGGGKGHPFLLSRSCSVQLPLKDNEQVNQQLLTFPQILKQLGMHRHTQQILLLRF